MKSKGLKRNLLRCIAAVAMYTLTFPALLSVPAFAEGPTIDGAGSTWSQIAIDQWRADVARQGLNVNYRGVGSTSGRNFYLTENIDFAVSEIPFEPEEMEQLRGIGKSFQYLPIVAGGTSFMYNLKDTGGARITDLRLSGAVLAGIFTGKIKKWTDPKITEDNGGRVLPEGDIIPVIRSDGSGTSNQFSAYLFKMFPDVWASFANERGIANAPTSSWPAFPGSVGQARSDGVANYVANDQIGAGSINYVEAGYAVARGRPVAQVRNQSGNYALPGAGNVAQALSHATFNADQTQNLDGVYRAPEPTAYPVSSYSYMITPTAPRDISEAKGRVLGEFILYFACPGQQSAERLGYSPLPRNLVQADFDAVRRIPGAPTPPPIEDCENPTINGKGYGGVKPTTTQTTSTQGGTQTGPSAAATTAAKAAAATASAAKAAAAATSAAAAKASGATPGSPQAIAEAAAAEEAAAEEAAAEEYLAVLVDPEEKAATLAAAGSLAKTKMLPFIIAACAVLALVFGPAAARLVLPPIQAGYKRLRT